MHQVGPFHIISKHSVILKLYNRSGNKQTTMTSSFTTLFVSRLCLLNFIEFNCNTIKKRIKLICMERARRTSLKLSKYLYKASFYHTYKHSSCSTVLKKKDYKFAT